MDGWLPGDPYATCGSIATCNPMPQQQGSTMTDLEALTRTWCLYVAGRIGIDPPTTGHASWLRLHWSEAVACMVPAVTCVMEAEVGEIRHE